MSISNIRVLDCTLRDGGYMNNWRFSDANIKRVIRALNKSGIDIIECGYLDSIQGTKNDSTLYINQESAINIIEQSGYDSTKLYVAMINYGDYDVETLEVPTIIQGIRLVFHKKHWRDALEDAKVIASKGYKVFFQPMATLSYSDSEILEMIEAVNELPVYAFYIVDSFGSMKAVDIKRLVSLVNHNLRPDICMGLHPHNNLQLAFSNALHFIENVGNVRMAIIDASIFGMGRGAGNLNSELILTHLNETYDMNYNIVSLLDIIDQYISTIHAQTYWGYSTGHYLSASYGCHPNYATYLLKKQKLSIPSIERILKSISEENKVEFDKVYIEELYKKSIAYHVSDEEAIEYLKSKMLGKQIIVVGPGKSVEDKYDIIEEVDNKVIVVINHYNPQVNANYYFFSNEKRYFEFLEHLRNNEIDTRELKVILTSNIQEDSSQIFAEKIQVGYEEFFGSTEQAADNAIIIFLHLVIKLSIQEVSVVGFDGYKEEGSYMKEEMEITLTKEERNLKNNAIRLELDKIKQKLNINYISHSIFE